MKPSKTIREMASPKLLKEFESEVNEYGGKRFDSLGEVMSRYNQNKIKMMRTELFKRLDIIREKETFKELIASIDTSEPEEMREIFEGFSFDKRD